MQKLILISLGSAISRLAKSCRHELDVSANVKYKYIKTIENSMKSWCYIENFSEFLLRKKDHGWLQQIL
jgi:hypothetical protein